MRVVAVAVAALAAFDYFYLSGTYMRAVYSLGVTVLRFVTG